MKMKIKCLILIVMFGIFLKPTFAEEAASQGSPITAENVVDVLEIQRVIDAQVDAYDNQQWKLARSFMMENFKTNVGQKNGGVNMMKSDAFLDRAKGYHKNTKEFVTHHSNSGYRVFFHDKNNASAFARGVIIVKSTPGGEHAKDGGSLRMERYNSYEYGVVKTTEGWKINKIMITYNADKITSLPKVQ